MESVIVRMLPMGCSKIPRNAAIGRLLSEKCYCTGKPITKKPKHPYQNIHPWRSFEEFAESLVAGVIHNKDGLVAINKPYGIPSKSHAPIDGTEKKKGKITQAPASGIAGEVQYSVSDALPFIAKKLGYSELRLLKTPERFTSGVTLLGADGKVENAVEKALRRAQGFHIVPQTYWAVTTRVPNEMKGEKRLAMQMKQSPEGYKKLPIIIESWSENQRKRADIKILNVQFKVISNSTENLSSLIEMKSSTKKWHALRLFAATVLYSPILGDNIHGSKVQNVMGRWMNISPFVDAAQAMPKLNKNLLGILSVPPNKQSMIPAHLHLREMFLPSFGLAAGDLILTAPPMPEFLYTCRQLQFKHEAFESDEEKLDDADAAEHSDPVRHEAVT